MPVHLLYLRLLDLHSYGRHLQAHSSSQWQLSRGELKGVQEAPVL